jgi:hypothetical protein
MFVGSCSTLLGAELQAINFSGIPTPLVLNQIEHFTERTFAELTEEYFRTGQKFQVAALFSSRGCEFFDAAALEQHIDTHGMTHPISGETFSRANLRRCWVQLERNSYEAINEGWLLQHLRQLRAERTAALAANSAGAPMDGEAEDDPV